MKTLILVFTVVASVFVSVTITLAQEPALNCQAQDINATVANANNLLANVQADMDGGNTSAALTGLSQIQSSISTLFINCLIEIPTEQPSEEICFAGILCDLFPQAVNSRPFVFAEPGNAIIADLMGKDCTRSGEYGLKLDYNLPLTAFGGWGVHWDNAPNGRFDASSYSGLTFWIRGTQGGEIFQMGVKDTSGLETKIESRDFVVVSASQWKMVAIPLDAFGVNTASVTNINFSFNDTHGSGSICIDDITLVSVTP